MNTQDIIITVLSFGTPFNPHNKVFRTVTTLASFCNLENEEVLELLAGDLSNLVVCKPSTKGKGILVALQVNVPDLAEDPQIAIAGGPALNVSVVNKTGIEEFNHGLLPGVDNGLLPEPVNFSILAGELDVPDNSGVEKQTHKIYTPDIDPE